jgi:hypothetical protein
MFQAVSLDGDVEAAKVLAYTVPRLRDGVQRVDGATLDLAAVVEPIRQIAGMELDEGEVVVDSGNEAVDRYRFGVRTMEEQGIRVLTLNDLARAAETARVELRV